MKSAAKDHPGLLPRSFYKEEDSMTDYKAVPSGLELSRRIADCLEASAPRGYDPGERPRAIQESPLEDVGT